MKHLSIRQQILLMTLLPLVGVIAIVGIYVYFNYVQEIDLHFEQQSEAHTRLLALYASQDLNQPPYDHLQILANGALEAPGVRAVRLLDSNLNLLAQAGPLIQYAAASVEGYDQHKKQKFQTDSTVLIRRPIYPADNTSAQINQPQARRIQGWLEVEYHRNAYAIHKYQTFIGSSLAILGAIIAAFALGNLITRRIQGRIGRLRQGVQALSHGFYDTHFHLSGSDELQKLAHDLNAMKSAVNSTFHELKSNLERSNTDLRETLETLEIQHIELDMARREAVEASRMKSEFLANTSHEIRTPLNSIIGFTNILLKSENDNRKQNYLKTVRHSAETLLGIINDILDFSKIEAGKLLLDEIPCNLRELAEESLNTLAPMASAKKLKLAVFADEKIPCSLLGDPLRIRQILTNLLNNAIKFTPTGYVYCKLILDQLDNDRAHITVEVHDTGIGLSEEQQQKAFTAFSQADASTSREYGGTGLGLVIVKRLTEQMGGDCGVYSCQGQGSRFWFSLELPVDTDAQPARHFQELSKQHVQLYDADELTREALTQLLQSWGMQVTPFDTPSKLLAADSREDVKILSLDYGEQWQLDLKAGSPHIIVITPEPETVPSHLQPFCIGTPYSHTALFDLIRDTLNNDHVRTPTCPDGNQSFKDVSTLVVDDNATNRQMLSLLLAEMGVKPRVADSGKAAVKLCREYPFDLIFMDLQMPQMDGIKTTQLIRGESLCQQSHIVALSAYPSPDDPVKLRNAGFDQFFSKPIHGATLQKIYTDIINNRPLTPQPGHPVDRQRSLTLAQNKPELARQMLDMLLDSLGHSCDSLQEALALKSREKLHETAHQICGACSYVAVPNLHNNAETLRRLLLENADWNDIKTTTKELINAAHELVAWRGEHDLEALFE